jgi:hypothetical protein
MEIDFVQKPSNGMAEVSISYYEVINDFGFRADVTVWVPFVDSYEKLHASAKEASKQFLERALLAHSDSNDEPVKSK